MLERKLFLRKIRACTPAKREAGCRFRMQMPGLMGGSSAAWSGCEKTLVQPGYIELILSLSWAHLQFILNLYSAYFPSIFSSFSAHFRNFIEAHAQPMLRFETCKMSRKDCSTSRQVLRWASNRANEKCVQSYEQNASHKLSRGVSKKGNSP